MKKPRISRQTYKFTQFQILDILKLIACFAKQGEIQDAVLAKTGKTIASSTINHYRNSEAFTQIIDDYRAQFNEAIKNEEFASERRRLQEMTQHYYGFKNAGQRREAVTTMVKINEMFCGRGNVNFSVTYNKFDKMTTKEILAEFKETARQLTNDDSKGRKQVSGTLTDGETPIQTIVQSISSETS